MKIKVINFLIKHRAAFNKMPIYLNEHFFFFFSSFQQNYLRSCHYFFFKSAFSKPIKTVLSNNQYFTPRTVQINLSIVCNIWETLLLVEFIFERRQLRDAIYLRWKNKALIRKQFHSLILNKNVQYRSFNWIIRIYVLAVIN